MPTKINKVLEVINQMTTSKFEKDATIHSLDKICKLYEFDRITSYIRISNDKFSIVDEICFDKAPIWHESNQEIKKKTYFSKNILETLIEENIIHTYDFGKYKEELTEIGFQPVEGVENVETFIKCMKISDNDAVGFLVFERFKSKNRLPLNEVFEIKNLCDLINDRVENFETRKQLKFIEERNTIDNLTNLPLINKFKERASELLEDNIKYAMVYMDIDKFKYVNEIWSHNIGDKILLEVSKVLTDFIDENELCCRIIDDKFGVFLRCENSKILSKRLKLLNNVLKKMQIQHFSDIKITFIGGVYRIEDETNINIIIDKANIARRSSKGTFENQFIIYNQNLDNLSELEKQLERKIISALENGEFIPFFQPKFNLLTSEIYGVEALARWKTPNKLIPPLEFIPTFERNGFITKLDFVIYEAVFEYIEKMLQKGYKMFPVSLNVSRGHMTNENFLEEFIALMNKYSVPINLVEIEITESVFMEDKEILKSFIEKIRKKRIKVSIDDFGTAYSSLNLLKDVDVDIIKIDKSFIDNICKDSDHNKIEKDKIIIKNVVTMINELKFETIFEGIETDEQVEFLKDVCCYKGQGYIFQRPVSLEDFEIKFLRPQMLN